MARMAELDLSPEGLAFHPATGDAFVVNDAALSILKSLQAGEGQAEAAGVLVEAYHVSREEALRDVLDFHERLRTLGLL
jgi:hypothetical protein